MCKAQSIKPRLNALFRNSPPFHPAAWVHGPAFKSQSFRFLHSLMFHISNGCWLMRDVYCSIKGFFGTAVPEVFREERDYSFDTSTGSRNSTVLKACREQERRSVYLSYLSYPLPRWCYSSLWSPEDRNRDRQRTYKTSKTWDMKEKSWIALGYGLWNKFQN